MKKWTMNVGVILKNLSVQASSREEAIKKIKEKVTDSFNISEISFDENSLKIDKKSISMSEE